MGASPLGRWARHVARVSVLALGCADAQAEIYRCVAKGRTSFRDKPCHASEKQSVILPEASRYAGCFAVEDSPAWEGGAGSWLLRLEHVGTGYVLREFRAVPGGKVEIANVPLHRASPEELGRATQFLRLQSSSGIVLELPPADPGSSVAAADTGPNGLFHIWDNAGQVRLVAVLPFANGFAQKVGCP